jgi:hypothetical protein
MKEETFVKIDLHIHTPSSIDCYKGNKNDQEYYDILKQAKKKDLKIISITDHNSLEGYKKLIQLEESLNTQKTSLEKITDSEQSKILLSEVKERLSLFSDILILPGLEFETNDGIHLLIIFNDSVQINTIERFLSEGGYKPEDFGHDNPSTFAKWDINYLLDESKNYNCIVIDAHTDSNKGILNTIPKGKARSHCFSHPQLSGVCYNSEDQKNKLQETMKTSKDYARSTSLAFVKFSDSHKSEDVGLHSTWIKIKNLSFSDLRTAFNNPTEMIFTHEPNAAKILQALLKLENSFGVPSLEDTPDLFKKVFCALANTNGGYILVGVTEDKTPKGVTIKKPYDKIILEKIKPILKELPISKMQYSFYDFIDGKIIISFRIFSSERLASVKGDDRIYSIKSKKIATLSASEIQNLVEERSSRQIESLVNKRIQSVEKDCGLIKNLFSSMPIIRSYHTKAIDIKLDYSFVNAESIDIKSIKKLNQISKSVWSNGKSKGNIFYFSEYIPPRYSNAYLRYSLPLFFSSSSIPKPISKPTIYIIPSGGVFYSTKDYPFYSGKIQSIVKIHDSPINSIYGMKFTVCFLKSSFLIWYLLTKFDDHNLYISSIIDSIRMPLFHVKNPECSALIENINTNFDQALKLEYVFLVKSNKIKEKQTMAKLIDEHNAKIDVIAYNIDKCIYKLLDLAPNEIEIIENTLKLNKLHLPKPLTLDSALISSSKLSANST